MPESSKIQLRRKPHLIRRPFKDYHTTARPRRSVSLDEKIEKATATVSQAKNKYDVAVEELNIPQKKSEPQKQELFKTIKEITRSYDEISWHSLSEVHIRMRNNICF